MTTTFVAPPEAYDVSFARLCSGTAAPILDQLSRHCEPGSSLLDVGCGTGRFALAADEAGYSVTAVDCSPDMIDFSRSRPGSAGPTWFVGASPGLPFPDGRYDVAVANFVVNHVADPRAVVRDLHRVVRSGGLVVSTIWGVPPPLSDIWFQIVQQAGADHTPSPRLSTDLDFQRSTPGLAELHRDCGAVVVASGRLEWMFVIEPVDLWRGVAAGIAGMGAVFHATDVRRRERMAEAFLKVTAPMQSGGLLHFPIAAPFVLASTP